MPTLSRILHIAHGIPSYNNSLVELANRLHRSGIELIVASHNDLSQLLLAQGHTFIALTGDTELESQRQTSMARCKWRRRPARWYCQYRTSRRYRQQSLHTCELSDLIERLAPDLLLIDMECHKVIVQTHASPLPVVLLSRWYTVFRQGNNPPMHTLHQPSQHWLDTLRIRFSWARLRWLKRWLSMRQSASRQRFKSVTYDSNSRSALKELARANAISLSKISDTAHWLIPHVYTQLPVMSLTTEALEFGTDKDSRMHYVGAMVGSDNSGHPRYEQGMAQYQLFLHNRQKQNNPLVYCSLSTFWDTETDLLASIIRLFTQRNDLDLVMGLGGRQPSTTWPDITDNILLLDYAPQLEVLKRANVAITHGGVSTINEALIFGVPLIVCSSGHVDQNGCTARVVHHGVGLACQSAPLDILELMGHIDHILGEDGTDIRNRVLEIQKLLQRCDSDELAIRFLLRSYADASAMN